jgi:environmental stress-induced protein Ves
MRLDPSEVEPVAWRNGLGVTRELVDDPDGWRLSVADLQGDAAFSEFAGLDRVFLPLVDVVLSIDGVRRAVARGTVARFPGEASVAVELVAGPGRAVNLMTVRGRCTGELAVVPRDDSGQGLFVDLGEVLVEVRVNRM